tara:strand:- start:50 stop:550 length:501 start_codon:yes stop_codon:yes gene_type:complete
MAGTYEIISTQTLGSAVSSVTFGSIPQTYTDLVLIANSSTTSIGSSEINKMTFNADTATNYSTTTLAGDGSSAASYRGTSVAYIRAGRNTANGDSYFVPNKIQIMNYANATTYKTALAQGPEASAYLEVDVGLWRSTSAITSVTLTAGLNNYKVGSTFSLYGIKAA